MKFSIDSFRQRWCILERADKLKVDPLLQEGMVKAVMYLPVA